MYNINCFPHQVCHISLGIQQISGHTQMVTTSLSATTMTLKRTTHHISIFSPCTITHLVHLQPVFCYSGTCLKVYSKNVSQSSGPAFLWLCLHVYLGLKTGSSTTQPNQPKVDHPQGNDNLRRSNPIPLDRFHCSSKLIMEWARF